MKFSIGWHKIMPQKKGKRGRETNVNLGSRSLNIRSVPLTLLTLYTTMALSVLLPQQYGVVVLRTSSSHGHVMFCHKGQLCRTQSMPVDLRSLLCKGNSTANCMWASRPAMGRPASSYNASALIILVRTTGSWIPINTFE